MRFLLFVLGLVLSRPLARSKRGNTRQEEILNEMLKAMDQVYSWKIVNYYGEYQKGLAQVDNDAVEIAFKFFDTNNDMKVSKEEMLGQMPVMVLSETFMQEYTAKYWYFVDRSNDGLLNYSEFKMAWSDIAAIFVQVGLQIDDKSTLAEGLLRFAGSSDSEPIHKPY